MNEGMENLKEIEDLEDKVKKTKEITKAYDAAYQLNRIASALEEILRLVKKDQEESKKRWEKETIGE